VDEARNLPPLTDNKKRADAYVLLWSSLTPKEEHKSKIHKKELSPKYNETFGFKFDPKVVKNGVLSGAIHLQFRNFVKIGTQFLGKEFVVPFELKEGEEKKQWVAIPETSTNAEVHITVSWSKLKASEIPEIILTRTGGAVAKPYYNSITRTALKKRIRFGDRGMDSEVHFLTVKVHEAKDLIISNRDTNSTDTFFSIFLHSSQQITYKSKTIRNSLAPKWENAEYGFELVSVINDKVRDALRLQFRNQTMVGDSVIMGNLYIPLDFIALNDSKTQWYTLEGVPKGEVLITVSRSLKKVSELPVQATSGSASVSKKLIYALSLAKRQMAEFGLKATITISLRMAVVETRISVSIDPAQSSPEETAAQAEQELITAEQAVDTEQEDVVDDQLQESKSIFKKMLLSSVQSLAGNLTNSLKDMRSVGLSGSVGCSIILGVPMYGIEFEIAVDVELAG